MLAIDFLPGARRDFQESFDWYARQNQEAAARFLDAVDMALNKIADDPQRFALIRAHYRECPLIRFPFRIVYRIIGNRILVVAIAHAKRRPGYWKARD
jgi:plasmid stabilization system protein ParE